MVYPFTFCIGLLIFLLYNLWSEGSPVELGNEGKSIPYLLLMFYSATEYFFNGLLYQYIKQLYDHSSYVFGMISFGYIFVGFFLWSPFRYYLFIKEAKKDFTSKEGLGQIKTKLHPKNQKSRIFSWALMWPLDFGWQMTKNPVKWIYNLLYKMATKIFEQIHKQVFGS